MRNAVFAGKVGKDAEVRFSKSGKPVASWSLAVDTFDGAKSTLWVDCSMWGERAEKLGPAIKQGNRMTVSGDVGVRGYEYKGESRAQMTLTVYSVTFQSARREDSGAQDKPVADEFADSVPF
jgi:single-strand DNA-binding protein